MYIFYLYYVFVHRMSDILLFDKMNRDDRSRQTIQSDSKIRVRAIHGQIRRVSKIKSEIDESNGCVLCGV